MWNDGFSVAKIDNDWYLYETKVCIENFSKINGQEPPSPPPEAKSFGYPPTRLKMKKVLDLGK